MAIPGLSFKAGFPFQACLRKALITLSCSGFLAIVFSALRQNQKSQKEKKRP
jgi:hypothetical protein